eukprot:scaffold38993_cov183-Amphora_coffeaeformis.AAC.4
MATNTSSPPPRQRSNAKKMKKRADKQKEDVAEKTSTTPSAADEPGEKTLWQTFSSHWSLPFYGITIAVLLPFYAQKSYLYLTLERPDLLAKYSGGLIRLRPPVALEDTRPVLIVGTISGATTQVAHDLQYLMDLEVCHETSETTRHFCRDGTVSWFHGIRFLPRAKDQMKHVKSMADLCTNFTENMGFHPRMYRDTSECSLQTKWSKCWARECVDLLHAEWGCAWVDDSTPQTAIDPATPCQTPYATTLHQARHPLRTIESLLAKFCPKDTMDEGFVKIIQALFHQHDFGSYTCLQAAGYYVLEYHKAMRKALKGGLIQQSYQVEETTPCQVASLAGFNSESDVVWRGSQERVTRVCANPNDGGEGHTTMTSTEYKVNYGKVALSKANFTDQTLWNELVALTKDLGYEALN